MEKKHFLFFILLISLLIGLNSVNANNLEDLSSNNVLSDSPFVEDLSSNNVLSDSLRAPNSNTIYVNSSYSGGIENGSQQNPYKSISTAVTNANDSDVIYIANGNYNQSKLDLTKSLSFIGESKDNVIIKGSGSYVFGCIENNCNLMFNNLTFTGIDATGSSTGLKVGGNGTLNIINCNFKDINAKYGALWLYTDNIANIINCTVENIGCSVSGGTGAIYITKGTVNIKNSLINNIKLSVAGQQVYMYGAIYIYGTDGTVNLVNSTVSNVCAVSDSVIRTNGKLNIINSLICDNYINKTNSNTHGFCIIQVAGNNAKINIEKSLFYNNSAFYGLVYAQRGTTNISYSAFYNNNNIIDGNDLFLINTTSTNSKTVTADYNWWGNNTSPKMLMSSDVILNNWIIMSVNSNTTGNVNVGDTVKINADFNKYTDGTTNSSLAEGKHLPDGVEVSFTGSGDLSNNIAYTTNGVATVNYVPTTVGSATITIKSGSEKKNLTIVTNDNGPSTIYVSVNGSDSNPGSRDHPVATIAKAIEIANGNIIILEGSYDVSSSLVINDNLNISGEGNVLIKSTASSSIFTVNPNIQLSLNKLNITGANNPGNNGFGGVIYNNGGKVYLNNLNLYNNSAGFGGVIYNKNNGFISISNSKLFNNSNSYKTSWNGGGGAIYNHDNSNLEINNCEFYNNTCKGEGASIQSFNANLIVNNSKFYDNIATGWAGGIYGENANILINNSKFYNNLANNGGALYTRTSYLNVSNSVFYNNKASHYPSVYYNYGSTAIFDNCTIYSNNAKKGVFYNNDLSSANATLTITNSKIYNNTVDSGTGIIYNYKGYSSTTYIKLNVSHSILISNDNTVIANSKVSNLVKITANDNWWGTNDNPLKLVPAGSVINEWVIMNVNSNASENLNPGDKITINVDFNHVNTTNGEIKPLTGGKLPYEFTVKLVAVGGTITPTVINTNNGEGSAEYTVTSVSNNYVNLTVDKQNTKLNLVKKTYNGTIYVSNSGDDNNEGSLNSPVATIAKAIELASLNGGSKQIIIKEGSYNESNLTISSDLTITGLGKVVIDGKYNDRLFNISDGYEVVFNNLHFTGAQKNFGAVIYNLNSNVTLNNVAIYSNNVSSGYGSSMSIIYNTGNMAIVNSTLFNNKGDGFIYNSGNIVINQSNIYNNEATNAGVYGLIYCSGVNCVVNIILSNFTNNTSRQGIIFNNGYTGTINVTGSKFINNRATIGSGGVIHSAVSLNIDKSVFINNTANKNGGAIYNSGNAAIINSVFINNTAGYKNSMNYNGNTIYNYYLGKVSINYCVVLEKANHYVIYNDGEADSSVNAQYNWWGTNDDPKTLFGSGTYEDDEYNVVDSPSVDGSNWVIMNVVINPSTNINENTPVSVTVDFNHYYDNIAQVIKELSMKLPNGIQVSFKSENGTFTKYTLNTTNGIANSLYTPVKGYNIITVDSSNAEVNITFNATGDSPGPKVYNLTNETFFSYFDASGNLRSYIVEGSTLNFIGEFGGLPNVSSITIDRKLNINGVNATLNDIMVQLLANNINMNNFKIIIRESSKINGGIIVLGNNIMITNNFINVTSFKDDSAYAVILADSNNIKLINNSIYFNGTGDNTVNNCGMDIYNSTNIELSNNNFEFILPSCKVDYDSYYNAIIRSVGISVSNTNNFVLNQNNIKTKFNGKVYGSYDTIYGVYIKGSNDVTISSNNLTSIGNNYMYSLSIMGYMDYNQGSYVSCDNFKVINNNINSISSYGGWGVQFAVANGSCVGNNLNIQSTDVAYGIYSEGYFGPLAIDYTNNTVYIMSNLGYGFSVSGQSEKVINNNITVDGNFTLGVYSGPFNQKYPTIIKNNTINSNGKGLGTAEHTDIVGIYVLRGKAIIQYNNITTTGNYTVYLGNNNNIVVTDNYLISNSLKGDKSVFSNGTNKIKDNLPAYSGIVYVSKTGNDDNEGSIDAPVATIKKAIEIALAKGGSGHIIIGPGMFNESALESDGVLLIEGAGIDETIINAKENDFIIMNSFGTLTLKGLSLINGKNIVESGGAIKNMGNLTLENVKIANSTSIQNGGAIYSVGNLKIINSTIVNNKAIESGGAIFADAFSLLGYDSSLVIINSNISYNDAESNQFGGGAIYMQVINGNKTIVNTTFASNKANAGGAIFMQKSKGDFIINDCEFIDNSIKSTLDTYGGGAICLIGDTYSTVGNVIVSGTNFLNNTAATSAGAILIRNVDLNISNSIIINNKDKNNVSIVKYTTSYNPSGFKVILNDNWWGNTNNNTEFDSTLLKNINTPTSYLILNISSNVTKIFENVKCNLTIDLTHNQNGMAIDGSKLPKNIPVTIIAVNGTVDPNDLYLVNGKGYAIYTGTSVGNGSLIANIYGVSCDIKFNIEEFDPKVNLTAENIIMYYKDGTKYVVVLTDSEGNPIAGQNITFNIGDLSYTKLTDNEGKASIELNLSPGIYMVTAFFRGSALYDSKNITNNITIKSTIEGKDIVKIYKNGTQYYVTFLNSDGTPLANRNVTFNIYGVMYTRETDENGTARLKINLNPGKYIVTVTNPVNNQTHSNNITVLSSISGNDITKIYKNGTQYYATFLNSDGTPLANRNVTFNIYGVMYTRVTDDNGIAKLNINLHPGEYIITAIHPDNGQMFSNKIKVLPTLIGKNLTKAYGSTQPFEVKLVDGKGLAISGVYITMNIYGVFYKRLTDVDGIARLNVNLMPGEYIVTSMYDGYGVGNKIKVTA